MNNEEIEFVKQKGILNSFRYGSEKFFDVCKAAKTLDWNWSEEDKMLLETDIGEFDYYIPCDQTVPLDFPDFETLDIELSEDQIFYATEEGLFSKAEFQGRDVDLNKPSLGDVKKYKVFVRNSKGNVVKVNFGLSVTRKLLEDPARRAAFTSRHSCETANDKTTPRYWSCRINRFFHKIHGGKPVGGTFW